jgi:anti-sigma factor RsiW
MGTCKPYKPLIGARVDGTATEAELAALRAHLADGLHCAREVRELERVRRLVTGLPKLRPSRGLMPAAMVRVRAQRISWFDRLFGGMQPAELRLVAGVALLLVVCIGFGLVALHGHGPGVATPTVVVKAPQPHMPTPTLPTSGSPNDEYLRECRLVHGALDQDRAFWGAEAVQLASYSR